MELELPCLAQDQSEQKLAVVVDAAWDALAVRLEVELDNVPEAEHLDRKVDSCDNFADKVACDVHKDNSDILVDTACVHSKMDVVDLALDSHKVLRVVACRVAFPCSDLQSHLELDLLGDAQVVVKLVEFEDEPEEELLLLVVELKRLPLELVEKLAVEQLPEHSRLELELLESALVLLQLQPARDLLPVPQLVASTLQLALKLSLQSVLLVARCPSAKKILSKFIKMLIKNLLQQTIKQTQKIVKNSLEKKFLTSPAKSF